MSPPRYRPDLFPPRTFDWPALLPLIGRAQRAIAGYEGVLHGVPNPDVLLSPLSAQEAVLSSRIEGTQSSLSEVLALGANGEAQDESARTGTEVSEVLNYRLALIEATELMERLPLSQRLIRRTHEVLMTGVRGRTADPGQYRRIQNWIGPARSTEQTAVELPPEVIEYRVSDRDRIEWNPTFEPTLNGGYSDGVPRDPRPARKAATNPRTVVVPIHLAASAWPKYPSTATTVSVNKAATRAPR